MGDRKVWLAVRNTALILCPVVFTVNMWLASISNRLEQAIQTVDIALYELSEKHADLRAEKEQIYSPENVRLLAFTKLSLDVPDVERVVSYR